MNVMRAWDHSKKLLSVLAVLALLFSVLLPAYRAQAVGDGGQVIEGWVFEDTVAYDDICDYDDGFSVPFEDGEGDGDFPGGCDDRSCEGPECEDCDGPDCGDCGIFCESSISSSEGAELDQVRQRLGSPLDLHGEVPFASVDLPFSFTFYGTAYDEAYVNVNGQLCFGVVEEGCYYSGGYIDEPDSEEAIMAPLWVELMADGYANGIRPDVYTYDTGTSFVVQWIVAEYYSGLPVNFAVELHNDDTFEFHYGQVQTAMGVDYEETPAVGIRSAVEDIDEDALFSYVDICDYIDDEDEEGDFDSYCSNPHYADSILFAPNDLFSLESTTSFDFYDVTFSDVNGYDHLFDEIAEPGVAGIEVEIYSLGGFEVDSTMPATDGEPVVVTTDENGYFSYTVPGEGEYAIGLDNFPDCTTSFSEFSSYSFGYELQHAQVFIALEDTPEEEGCEVVEEVEEVVDEVDDSTDTPVVEAVVEDAGPNDGDANGDGFADSTQDNVASQVNPVTNKYAVIESSAGTTVTAAEFIDESALPVQDSLTSYPVGLASFTLDCGTPGCTSTVTVTYDQVYDTSTWAFKKYQNETFTDISSIVTYGTVTVGADAVTTASYDLVDGGPYDADGVENGIIVDPAGPAVLAALADTGSFALLSPLTGVAIAGVAVTTVISSARTARKEC